MQGEQGSVQRSAAVGAEGSHRSAETQRGEATRQFVQPETTAVAPSERATASAPEPVTALPLETVWPVQRQTTPAPTSQPAIVQPPAGPMIELPAEEANVVRHTLSRVSSGQPTDSSVELVLPRRPRPTTPKPSTISSGNPVQRQPGEPAAKTEPAAPAVVQTDIGPLPADLWQILGQEPPAQTAAHADTAVMRAIETAESPTPAQPMAQPAATDFPPAVNRLPLEQAQTAESAVVADQTIPALTTAPTILSRSGLQRNETTPAIMRQTDTPTSLPHATLDKPAPDEEITGKWEIPSNTWVAPPDIQREETASTPAPAPTPANGENGETKTAEVDIDDVARRVYKDLKRRLVVEWERVRGRF